MCQAQDTDTARLANFANMPSTGVCQARVGIDSYGLYYINYLGLNNRVSYQWKIRGAVN